MLKISFVLYLVLATPSLMLCQQGIESNIDSIEYFRNKLLWHKYHDEIDKIVTSKNAIAKDDSIIGIISKESKLLSAIDENIESSFIWNFAAKMYAVSGSFEKAIPYYEKAIDQLSTYNDTTYLHLIHYYHSQAIILGTNDPTKALESSTEALRLYKKRKDVSPQLLGKLHYAQGWSYRGLHEFDKAIESFDKAIELSGDEDGYIETFLCRTYLEMNDFENALKSAKKADAKFQRINNKPNHEYILLIGRAKSGMGQHKEAERLINRSISLGANTYSKQHTEYIKLFYFLAKAQFKACNFDKSIESIQSLFTFSFPEISNKKPTLNNITSPFPNLWVLDGMILLGQVYLAKFKLTDDVKDLESALECFNKSIEDVHLRRAELTSWMSKQEFNKYAFDAFDGAIESSHLLYNKFGNRKFLNQLLNYIEGSRSILLKSYQREIQRQDLMLSHEHKEMLDCLKREIAEIEKAYYLAVESNTIKDVETLNNELVEKRKEWKVLIKPFSEYAEKTDIKNIENGTMVTDIQNQLNDSTILLMYYELKHKILSITLTKNEVFIKEIDNKAAISSKLIDLYSTLSDWKSIQKSYSDIANRYFECATFLGEELLRGLKLINQSFNKIIIIPHGNLFAIPFEVLQVDNKLLIEKSAIQYVLACDQILLGVKPSIEFQGFFGGFAPSYTSYDNKIKTSTINEVTLRENLINLEGTRKTLEYLSNKFKGEMWLGRKATKEAFLNNAYRFEVLHLGMHGQIHNEKSNLSKLSFDSNENSSLTVGEIQSLNLKTEMVVLSACQTNVGILKEGEGPLSLAYAFLYAGSKSILSSLWSVPDMQTSQLMISYYDYLEKGLEKSHALQKAKLDYINSAIGIEKHPSYWAGFIIIGSDYPITYHKPRKNIYLILTTILLFGIVYIVRIKKS